MEARDIYVMVCDRCLGCSAFEWSIPFFDSAEEALEWAEKQGWMESDGVTYCEACLHRMVWEYDNKVKSEGIAKIE